ncbi:hypothetical protein [Hyphomicrobium sp.]|uniref:hypothetical protein n=1 Tax=Hyphomicrobium sp. TaxID=82 RepID=UPI0035635605
MKTISKAAFAAVALVAGSFASQANAETFVRYIGKSSVPYVYTIQPEPEKVAARQVHYRHAVKHTAALKTASKADILH